jgi:cobaltochelatase CobN
MKLIQASSLSPQEKAKYAEILAKATLTDPLYVSSDAPTDGDGQSETNPSSDKVLVNGTSENNGDASGSAGGQTAVGNEPSTSSSDVSSASSAQSSNSASGSAGADASQSSDSQAYEISKSSPAKSVSGESSMPIVVVIAVIALIIIFMVGYTRNKDDFDDY